MILCLDLGNTKLSGGLYSHGSWTYSFSIESCWLLQQTPHIISQKLRSKVPHPFQINEVAICSVVHKADTLLKKACLENSWTPFFLNQKNCHGLKINYTPAHSLGHDRLANSLGALYYHPQKNLLVVDIGTATTICSISKKREYLGGMILPGPQMSLDALAEKTGALPSISFQKRKELLGRSTHDGILTGVYHTLIGYLWWLKKNCILDNFADPLIVATGGYSHLYKDEKVIDYIWPQLTLEGVRLAQQMNKKEALL